LFATFDANDSDADLLASSSPEADFSLPSGDEDSRPNAAQLRAREADWIARRHRSTLERSDASDFAQKNSRANGRPELRPAGPGDMSCCFERFRGCAGIRIGPARRYVSTITWSEEGVFRSAGSV